MKAGCDEEEIMNDELIKLDIWFKINKLSLNIQKTKYMIYLPVKNKSLVRTQLNLR